MQITNKSTRKINPIGHNNRTPSTTYITVKIRQLFLKFFKTSASDLRAHSSYRIIYAFPTYHSCLLQGNEVLADSNKQGVAR